MPESKGNVRKIGRHRSKIATINDTDDGSKKKKNLLQPMNLA
jgi:hypothetical protein